MTDKIYKRTDVYIKYENAVVPDFDNNGNPDLLGWDEAMASHEANTDPIATFYLPEYAEICMPAIRKHYEGVDLNEVYQSDYVDIVCNDIHEKKEELTVEIFWKEILSIDNGFSPEDHGWDEDATDINGKEYLWNEDELLQQIPKFCDFQKSCKHLMGEMIDWCVDPFDSFQAEISYTTSLYEKTARLAAILYGKVN